MIYTTHKVLSDEYILQQVVCIIPKCDSYPDLTELYIEEEIRTSLVKFELNQKPLVLNNFKSVMNSIKSFLSLKELTINDNTFVITNTNLTSIIIKNMACSAGVMISSIVFSLTYPLDNNPIVVEVLCKNRPNLNKDVVSTFYKSLVQDTQLKLYSIVNKSSKYKAAIVIHRILKRT